jgi:predicted DNA-binding protein with PD1-like motif
MRYSQGSMGRVVVMRLEDGDVVHECIERVAAAEGISRGFALLVGGVDQDSTVVVGPEDGGVRPVVPMERVLYGVHEAAGVGTIFPDEKGRPVLHMHAALGRDDRTVAGCIRRGVKTWVVLEAILVEIVGNDAVRRRDPGTGFDLLQV